MLGRQHCTHAEKVIPVQEFLNRRLNPAKNIIACEKHLYFISSVCSIYNSSFCSFLTVNAWNRLNNLLIVSDNLKLDISKYANHTNFVLQQSHNEIIMKNLMKICNLQCKLEFSCYLLSLSRHQQWRGNTVRNVLNANKVDYLLLSFFNPGLKK